MRDTCERCKAGDILACEQLVKIANLERELSEVRSFLLQLVEVWDDETKESVENQTCAFQAPPDWETLIQLREAAGYETKKEPR